MYKRIAFAGDVLSGKEVLLAAEGIAVDLSFHICRHEIEQGRLVRVLAGWHRPPGMRVRKMDLIDRPC